MRRAFISILIFLLCTTVGVAKQPAMIRVLLATHVSSSNKPVTLSLPAGCTLATLNGRPLVHLPTAGTIRLFADKGRLEMVGRQLPPLHALRITPGDTPISLNGNQYAGSMVLHPHPDKSGTLNIINHVPIEEYIYSVLRYESYQSWPHEMHKVQAIASRTYAHHYCQRNKARTYDVTSTNNHQTYKGLHRYTHLRDAITQCANTVMVHNGKLITAMFDACCGGAIPADMSEPDFEKSPYLARSYACTHCKEYQLSNWRHEFDTIALMGMLIKSSLAPHLRTLGTPQGIHATHDKAGVVQTVTFDGSIGSYTAPAEQVFAALQPQLKSKSFTITQHGTHTTITGKGFGHQLGLCQRGAHALVKRGWHHKAVLRFYYPGISFKKV